MQITPDLFRSFTKQPFLYFNNISSRDLKFFTQFNLLSMSGSPHPVFLLWCLESQILDSAVTHRLYVLEFKDTVAIQVDFFLSII